jgi:hypothetical protein
MILEMLLIFMCTASLTLRATMDITVHNQHPDIELVSSVCFCGGGTYNEYPAKRVNTGTMMKIGFRFGLGKLSGGILMYEVQRKGDAESDHQSSTDITSVEAVEDTSKTMLLLVVWKIEGSRKPKTYIILVEHDNGLVLDEDKLAQLHGTINDQLFIRYKISKSTWLVCDNTILEATYETVQKESFKLKITISKGAKDKYTNLALWIDPERQVLFLMIIYSANLYC